jgi:peptidoglycan/xylan/chitin deacetylase (PgdA/CDA1 family)
VVVPTDWVARARGWVRSRHRLVLGLAASLLAGSLVALAVALRPREPRSTATSPTASSTTSEPAATTAGPRTTRTTRAATPTTSVLPSPTTPATTSPEPPAAPPAAVVVYRGDPSRRTVGLTFDAGSDAGHAAEILDTLASNRITATFGITGRFAESFPEVVRRVATEGHRIVNHSYDHPSFTGTSTGTVTLTAEQRAAQLRRAEAAIRAAAGLGSDGWFRPPFGDIDAGVERDVAAAGWPTILMWTVDSLGWQGIGADAVVARCLERAEPGAIYLFHVGQAADDAAALQRIIDGLRAAGYGFETVVQMIG